MLLWLLTAVILSATFLYLFYQHYYQPYFLFKKYVGISGPLPSVWYGNLRSIVKFGYREAKQFWTAKYGDTFLYYLGIQPFIFTQDMRIVRSVLSSNAGHFVDRPSAQIEFLVEKRRLKVVACLNGEEWKRQRRLLSPFFIAKKAKLAVNEPVAEVCCTRLVQRMTSKGGSTSINVYDLFHMYTMEISMANMFGIDVNSEEGVGKELYDAMVFVVDASNTDPGKGPAFLETVLSHCSWAVPALKVFARSLSVAKKWDFIKDCMNALIKDCQENGKSGRNAILQYLFGASINNLHNGFTDDEILDLTSFLLFASTDTTKYALSLTAYLLALNPAIQDRLINKIQMYFSEHPDALLSEAAESIPYVEMVLLESLRLYPVDFSVQRFCTKSCVINGVIIPKGTAVELAAHTIGYNPDLWPNPEEFNPDRFSSDQSIEPFAFSSFGGGPRVCIGKRLGLASAKIGLISILKSYCFVRADDTEVPPEIVYVLLFQAKNGIKLKVLPHQSNNFA